MTNTIMFDLQAAAMAAAVSGGSVGAEDIPEDGVSFSEVLSGATGQKDMSEAAASAETAGSITDETEASDGKDIGGIFGETMKYIENSDSGVKKALKLLLETVINAMKGPDDGKDRKTDLFAVLTGTGLDADGFGEDDLLLGAEIMENIAFMIEARKDASSEAENILSGIEDIVSEILGVKDDDTDENSAADALAAMLNLQPEIAENVLTAGENEALAAVTNAAEAFKAPMDTVREEIPEKVPEAEKLFSELKAKVSEKSETANPTIRLSFAVQRINNASEQVNAIVVRTAPEAKVSEDTDAKADTAVDALRKTEASVTAKSDGEEAVPEIAAAAAQPADTAAETETEVTEIRLEPKTAASAERQVTETVRDEIAEFGDKDGTKELVLILRPKELGEVAVKLVKEGTAVSVVLSAQYEEVGKLMTERAAFLGSSLSNQNYQVKDVQVVEPGYAAEQMGLNFTDRGFSFGQNGAQQNSSDGNNGGYDENDSVEEISTDNGIMKLREAKLWTTA